MNDNLNASALLRALLPILASVALPVNAEPFPDTDDHGNPMTLPKGTYLIRSRDSGVWIGDVLRGDYTPAGLVVDLANARRLWSWEGAAELSQIAQTGTIGQGSRLGMTTTVQVIGVCEVQPLGAAQAAKLRAHVEWKK